MYTNEQLDEIRHQGAAQLEKEPRVSQATYNKGILTFDLFGGSVPTGASVSVPVRSLRAFEGASEEQLSVIHITATGNAVHWPCLDVQMSVIALLEIVTGLPFAKYDAVATGAQGGAAKTEAKAAAVRANGVKGGRPRKKPVEA